MFTKSSNKIVCLSVLVGLFTLLSSCKSSKAPVFTSETITERDIEEIEATPETDAPEPVKKNKKAVTDYQLKYAEILGVSADQLNARLYKTIDEWMGTPYLYGGESKSGIDCSAFARTVVNRTFKIDLPRTANGQFNSKNVSLFKNGRYLEEGDLIFFKTSTEGPLVSHIGIYLHNDKFINSNTSKGVTISNLTDSYWKYKIVAFGRLIK